MTETSPSQLPSIVPPVEAPPSSVAPAQKQGIWSPLMVDALASAGAIAAGVTTAWRLTAERAYKNISSTYLVEDIKQERSKTGSELRKIVQSSNIPEAEKYKALQNVIKRYEGHMDERHHMAGVRSSLNKWGLLRRDQKAEVLITAFAVAGVALGSIMLMTRGLMAEKDQQALAPAGEPENAPQR